MRDHKQERKELIMNKHYFIGFALIASAGSQASAAPRDMQFTFIDTVAGVITIQNTGINPVNLDRWRFCTQNSSVVRRYTNPSALNGITIAPGESFTVHMDNDATPGDSSQINASSLGAFASFELQAFGLSFYFPNSGGFTPFSDGNFIADHMQWSIDGADNTTADERSDEAQAGGVWIDQSAWINVRDDTVHIELTDPSFGELHSPADYGVTNACPADLVHDQALNFFDVSQFLGLFALMDNRVDYDHNGIFNFFDVSIFLSSFNAGCP